MDFSVVIAASAPVENGGLVHAVTVVQPIQTWSVIRGQGDFTAVAESLAACIPGLPPCPYEVVNDGDINSVVNARNGLQQWLSTVLMYAEARNSAAMQNFLTYAINMIPPQYENVPWTIFTANGQVASPAPAPAPQEQQQQQPEQDSTNLDDMMMDDMFDGGDDVVGPLQDDSDDEEEYRASIRYAAIDEPVTEEDEMDIANAIAGEFEMIDDVGSLAQSLGASHLGRSLMLQEEMMTPHEQQQQQLEHQQQLQQQPGVQLGAAISGAGGGGGIGSAMEHAVQNNNTFKKPVPESPPRLDAFKMIKVIGKGSFGTYGLLHLWLYLLSR